MRRVFVFIKEFFEGVLSSIVLCACRFVSIGFFLVSFCIIFSPATAWADDAEMNAFVDKFPLSEDVLLTQEDPIRQPLRVMSADGMEASSTLRFDGVDDELHSNDIGLTKKDPWFVVSLEHQRNCGTGGSLLSLKAVHGEDAVAVFASKDATQILSEDENIALPSSDRFPGKIVFAFNPWEGASYVFDGSKAATLVRKSLHPQTKGPVWYRLRFGAQSDRQNSWCGDIRNLHFEQLTHEEWKRKFALSFQEVRPLQNEVSEKAREKQADSGVAQRILLLGDAGNFDERLDAAVKQVSEHPKVTHLYLGDNIYPHGLEEDRHPNQHQSRMRLERIFRLSTESNASPIFIPGNHDWANAQRPGMIGYESLLRQETLAIDRFGEESFAPRHGCPDPTVRKLAEDLYIVVIDSQWFLHPFDKPTSTCRTKTTAEFARELRRIVQELRVKGTVLLASHHPLESFGTHRNAAHEGCRQDLLCPIYQKEYRDEVFAALKGVPASLCVAGHDHSSQLIRGNDSCSWFVVSGGMSHPTPVTRDPSIVFSHGEPGFGVIDIGKNGDIWYRAFGRKLFTSGADLLFEHKLSSGKQKKSAAQSKGQPTQFTRKNIG